MSETVAPPPSFETADLPGGPTNIRPYTKEGDNSGDGGGFWLVVWLLFVAAVVFVVLFLMEPETDIYEQCTGGYRSAETCATSPASDV